MKKIVFSSLVCIFLLATPAMGEEVEIDDSKDALGDFIKALTEPMESVVSPILELGDIVVSPTKSEEKLGAQSSAVTLISEETIKRGGFYLVKDALKGEMGIDAPALGAFTGQTSVFMRGTNSNHAAVMVDGLKVYDPISTNGAFNLGHITLDNIGKIEIVRGPQSSLYGSDAIGGVINIITKKAEEPFFNGQIEAGSFSTFRESFSFGSVEQGLHYSIGGSNVKSRGISHAQAKNNNPELDGYERSALSARIDYDMTDSLSVGGTFRHTSTLFDYDEFGRDDPNVHQRDFQTLATNYLEHRPFDFYGYFITLGWMHNFRKDNDANNGRTVDYLRDWYKGYAFKLDYRNNLYLSELDTFTIGYEYTEEMGDSYYFIDWGTGSSESDMPKVFSRNNALYLQNRFNMKDRLTATQGLRLDRHSNAGDHVTYKLDGSYLFPTGTKIRGGWSTGFNAPTLYQLNAPSIPSVWGWGGFGGGNPELSPETSESYEIGADQYLFGERAILTATYFHTVLHDLIDTTTDAMWNISQFMNIGKAHSSGWELEAKFRPIDRVEIRSSYTYNYTKDFSTDRPLLRRPLHKFKVNTYWEICPKWDVNMELRYSGLAYDINADKLKPYLVVDVNTNYRVCDNLSVFLKIINAFDKKYEEIRSYGTSPFAVYAGTRTEF